MYQRLVLDNNNIEMKDNLLMRVELDPEIIYEEIDLRNLENFELYQKINAFYSKVI